MNLTKSYLIVLFVLLMTYSAAAFKSKTPGCEKWHSLVMRSAHSFGVMPDALAELSLQERGSDVVVRAHQNRDPNNVNSLSDEEILKGISCFLELKGRREPSRLAGVTSDDISQFVGRASVEVAALYYINYLFKGIYDHAYGYVLLDNDSPPAKDKMGALLTRGQDASRAYIYYARWFQKVRRIGLSAARQQHLDPLAGTSLQWYGEHDP